MNERNFERPIRTRTIERDYSLPGQSARRMFGLDFMLVVLLLTFVLYYFWPKMFKIPEPYAPESAVRETFVPFLEAKERCRSVIEDAQRNGHNVRDALKSAFTSSPSDEKQKARIFLYDLRETYPPIENPHFLQRKQFDGQTRGSYIHTVQGEARLVLFERIDGVELYLVAETLFRPLFKEEIGAQ